MHWASSWKWSLCSLCFPLYSYFIHRGASFVDGGTFDSCLLGCGRALAVASKCRIGTCSTRCRRQSVPSTACVTSICGIASGPSDALPLSVELRQQTGFYDPTPGFKGMMIELRAYQRSHTVEEQADCSSRIMAAMAGPLPEIFQVLGSRSNWAPAALAFFTRPFLHFLVGNMTLTQRALGDERAGGVLVERCSVLEHGGCKGLCLHMCKIPTERMFAARWGLPLTMRPNFETYECQLSFGLAPPPIELDPYIPIGCLSNCPAAGAHGDAQLAGQAEAQPRDGT